METTPSYEQLLARIQELESQISRDNERFAEICQNISEFFYEHDEQGFITGITPQYIGQLGLNRDDLVGTNISELITQRYRKYFGDYLSRVLTKGKDEGLMQVLGRDGNTHIIEYKDVLTRNSDGRVTIRGIARDVTDRLETEQALIESDVRFRIILDTIEDGYFEVDLNGCFTFFNNRIPEHLGYTHEEMTGMSYTRLMDGEQAAFVFRNFHNIFLTGEAVKSLEWELMKKDGTPIYVETSVSLKKNRKDEPVGFQGIIRDVTDRKRSEQELAYLAYHDPLTGLYNRKAFMEKLSDTIREARRYEVRRAVLYLDLDHFKKVNDVYGHETGDRLLIEVATRLKGLLRDSDYISRLGGDEFTIILTNSRHLHAEKVAQRIVERIAEPYRIEGTGIDFISASVGISIFPDDGCDAQTLLKNADLAMYRAKEQRNCLVRFSNVIPYPQRNRARKKA